MRLNQLIREVTRPTDPGLVIDVRDLKVTEWSADGGKIRFRLEGGTGLTLAGAGQRGVWADVDLPPLAQIDDMTELLQRWRTRQTSLRWVMAPGKGGLLVEDANRVLPLPRNPRVR